MVKEERTEGAVIEKEHTVHSTTTVDSGILVPVRTSFSLRRHSSTAQNVSTQG